LEPRNIKMNQISATKKSRKIRTVEPKEPKPPKEPREPRPKATGEQRGDLQKQVLSWDGLAAALSFSVPFVVVIAINFQSGLALSAILAAVLLPISLLYFSMREKLGFPPFLTVPVCMLASVGITSFAAVIIRRYFPQINDSLGIYIYLLSAYPVIAAVFYGKPARKLSTTVAWALRNILYFSCFVIISGIIREFLAYNRVIGIELSSGFKLEGAKMPFFGFIVFAFILAGATCIHKAFKARFPTPVPQPNKPEDSTTIPEPMGDAAAEEKN